MFFKTEIIAATLASFLSLGMGNAMSETGGLQVSSQIKAPNGDAKNCASRTAYAIPVSKKSSRVMKRYYDSHQHGFLTIYSTPELIWSTEGYNVNHLRSTHGHRLFQTKFRNTHRVVCDEDGVASFENLKTQDYYVVIPIFWKDGSLPRGEYYDAPSSNRSNTNQRSRLPANYLGGTLMARLTVIGNETQDVVFVNE